MKRIAVYPNLDKPLCVDAFREIVAWLRRRRLEVRYPAEAAGPLGEAPDRVPEGPLLQDADLMVVLGGDGTLLSAARLAYPARVPILGINFGGLGFLTDIGIDTMFDSMERVLRGAYREEPRMMMSVSPHDREGRELERAYALNDVVLRETGGRAIEIETRIEGTSLGRFRGDGIIIATPTGSTAYSLSAGGPIVQPTLEALIATPICPHAFSFRPLLFPANETIEVRYRSIGTDVHLAVDGQVMLDLGAEHSIRVRRARRSIYFVLVENRSFYEVLRTKLRWGGA